MLYTKVMKHLMLFIKTNEIFNLMNLLYYKCFILSNIFKMKHSQKNKSKGKVGKPLVLVGLRGFSECFNIIN